MSSIAQSTRRRHARHKDRMSDTVFAARVAFAALAARLGLIWYVAKSAGVI